MNFCALAVLLPLLAAPVIALTGGPTRGAMANLLLNIVVFFLTIAVFASPGSGLVHADGLGMVFGVHKLQAMRLADAGRKCLRCRADGRISAGNHNDGASRGGESGGEGETICGFHCYVLSWLAAPLGAGRFGLGTFQPPATERLPRYT